MTNIDVSIECDPSRRREIQQNLTSRLTEWFGDADSNRHFAKQAEILTGYVARLDGAVGGMLLLKAHSPISIEIYWLGVEPNCHRAGLGRALVEAACKAAKADGAKFAFVSAAAKLPRSTLYKWREALPDFAEEWREALRAAEGAAGGPRPPGTGAAVGTRISEHG